MTPALRVAPLVVVCWFAVGTALDAQVPAGPEFRVNTYTTDIQWEADVAMQQGGNFVVVWGSHRQDGFRSVFGQRFDSSGAALGTEFRVNSFTTAIQYHASVAASPTSGDFVVVWEDRGQRRPMGRRYDRSGAPRGGEFVLNSYTTGASYAPWIAMAPDGGFVVAWRNAYIDGGGGSGVAARRFDASGTPLGDDFPVNTYTTGYQFGPAVGIADDGSFVIAWTDFTRGDGSQSGVFAQRHDAAGNRLGGEFLVNTYTFGSQAPAAVMVSPARDFLVTWSGWDGDLNGVFAQRFDAAGAPIGGEFRINTNTLGDQAGGGIASDDAGNYVIVWQHDDAPGFVDLFAQRFDATDARRGAEFRINTYTTGSERNPSVAGGPEGNFVVTWQRPVPAGPLQDQDVNAQRFGGLDPAALALDTTGNRVLEPGETVDVRPGWRNSIGAPQAFTGTLASIAGPAGATYSITDGAGDYGSVADGSIGPCVDCYAVSVSNPSVRPAPHWDAAAVENIAPDTLGQRKDWLLHVGASFADVPAANGFYRFVETLLHHGVTGGCAASAYCPAASTTREQMAAFVLVAKEGAGYVPPACMVPPFADVPVSSTFCPWIAELARRGVVSGCGGSNYCPSEPVSRQQMAVFVLATKEPGGTPPACGTPVFNDVPAGSPFCRWIEELARRGVVTGCGGGAYCPTAPVTREQMGVFLSVTFGLLLYGP
jgi:hypothetical protein